MSMAEEKWSTMQQQQPAPQVPPSPHHSHSSITPQMNGVTTENFLPGYTYEGQSQMSVHEGENQMYPAAKPDLDATPRQSPYPGYVPLPSPNTPTTPHQNESPITPQTPQSAPEQHKVGERQSFSTGSFPATPIGAIRKRRADSLGFNNDTGPFFSATKQHYNLTSMDRTNSFKLRIHSKVDRGFFLADQDWTCYRRNYFQISSAFSITAPHPVNEMETPCLLEVDGQIYNVTQFLLGITARVSNSDKKIELVQHTPKRDKGPQMVPMPKTIRAGGNLNLSSVGTNANIVTFERIQFKTATANNGKRRAAQQYYVILVDLYAHVESGELHRVATSTSAPLVVRGRSPGHYADSHDRYNPMAPNSAFANERNMAYSNPHAPNGSPGVMQGEFNNSPFSPYTQYPPGYPGYASSPTPIRGDMTSLMMSNSAPNSPTQPFHSQHSSHQPYMVPSISDVAAAADATNPELYNNGNVDPNTISSHDQKIQSHHHSQVGMEIHAIEAQTPNHHSAFTSFDSRMNGTSHEYVDGFQIYHNGHPGSNASAHHGGYHSEGENHHANGYPPTPNARVPSSPHQPSSPQLPSSEPDANSHNTTTSVTQRNGRSKAQANGSKARSLKPPARGKNKVNTAPLNTELHNHNNLGQITYRMGQSEEVEK
ncbi:hypothetical protein G9A89_001845 [Geosiphon pyriformis]|nr:hypothetical protein G9A89_001845 [Geosiphon pyriformis]